MIHLGLNLPNYQTNMMNKKAIVTLAIGDRYIEMFDGMCRDGWSKYCEKFGYDLIVIKEFLDASERAKKRSPAWQKLLICSQDWARNYDQLVWVDTDVLINFNSAEDICKNTPIEKISAVETWSIPSRQVHDISLKRLYESWDSQGIKYIDNLLPRLYYQNRGIDVEPDIDSVVQTGVFVCSPSHHRELFEHIYNSYEDSHGADWNYEMPAMSYEIIRNNLQHWIGPEYNFCVSNLTVAFYPFLFHNQGQMGLHKRFYRKIKSLAGLANTNIDRNELLALRNIFELGYFIHFAGCSSLMAPLHSHLKRDGLL